MTTVTPPAVAAPPPPVAWTLNHDCVPTGAWGRRPLTWTSCGAGPAAAAGHGGTPDTTLNVPADAAVAETSTATQANATALRLIAALQPPQRTDTISR